MMKCALIVILAIFATQSSADFVNTLLEAQNAYRTVLNVDPLTWSADLAASAQQWADHLAEIGSLVHSGSSNGENLAYITGTYTFDPSDASSTDANTDNTSTDNSSPASTNTDNSSTDNSNTNNANTDNSSTDNSSPVNTVENTDNSSTDNSNTDNSSNSGSNNGDNSNPGFLSSQPAPTTQSQDNSQNGNTAQSAEPAQPKTHWTKTKTDSFKSVTKFSTDGGNSDGRRLTSGGRRLSESDQDDADLVRLVGLWGAEKQYFVYGKFPEVSSTGDWTDVGHYTQLVWGNTKQVGCGIANGHGNEYLVCQYYPAGNWQGEVVY